MDNLKVQIIFPDNCAVFTKILFVCFSDAHTSSLMISDSDSDNEEEIIFDDDLNRQKVHQSGMNGGSLLSKRNGIITNHNQPRA